MQEIIKNQKYRISVIKNYYFDKNGIKKYHRYTETFYGKKSEAKIRESEIKINIKKNVFFDDTKITFNELIDKWYEEIAMPNLQQTTIDSYNNLLIRIRAELGHYKLNDLKAIILTEFYNKLRRIATPKKLTESTIEHYYVLVNRLLNVAVKWDYIERNVNEKVDRPKPLKKEAKFYDMDDIYKLLEALKKEENIMYRALILLALDTGARRGEISGLTWDDIDFNDKTIHINKTTQNTSKGVLEKDRPKNDSSIRYIPLTDLTFNTLIEYKNEQEKIKNLLGNKWENSDKVFTTKTGGIMHPDTPRGIFSKIIKKYNLKPINFHGLRHSNASLQIALGIQMKVISKRLGHSSSTTTDMIYSHINQKINKEVTDRLNVFFDSAVNKNR